MVALIDVNVILNYVTLRDDPYTDASVSVMKKASEGEIEGYIAFHSVSILSYILRTLDSKKRRLVLRDICEVLAVTGASHDEVVKAIENDEFEDIEDCLQDKCAKAVDADYIITCNIKDYDNSTVPAILPDEFLRL